ncbi:MAG: MoxR family ATPase [Rhodocyclaceae bacterium]|nr:MoxR family ATPase [Rhodocyclaceae bacterium]MCA3146140.1 MoxR family ATPase [Rhodocyclaceae bacterium]
MTTATLDSRIQQFQDNFRTVREEVGRVIVGNQEVIAGVMTCLLARGHVLLEGIPGVGKTKLVQTLADALHLKFSRIQFTPDLMPGDIVGTSIVREDESGRKRFEFQPGPVFANLVLADEINRATPKTQSALLEAMQENSVSAGGATRPLEQPFFVLATMNPLEMEGTYPLPEAQLDRFFFKLRMGFPGVDELHEVVDRTTRSQDPAVQRVLRQGDVLEMRETAREVPVARAVQDYAVRLTLATHPESDTGHDMARRYVRFGASPRGTQALILGAKVNALVNGRVHVAIEDIRAVALPALRHRLMLNFEAEAGRVGADDIIARILEDLRA